MKNQAVDNYNSLRNNLEHKNQLLSEEIKNLERELKREVDITSKIPIGTVFQGGNKLYSSGIRYTTQTVDEGAEIDYDVQIDGESQMVPVHYRDVDRKAVEEFETLSRREVEKKVQQEIQQEEQGKGFYKPLEGKKEEKATFRAFEDLVKDLRKEMREFEAIEGDYKRSKDNPYEALDKIIENLFDPKVNVSRSKYEPNHEWSIESSEEEKNKSQDVSELYYPRWDTETGKKLKKKQEQSDKFKGESKEDSFETQKGIGGGSRGVKAGDRDRVVNKDIEVIGGAGSGKGAPKVLDPKSKDTLLFDSKTSVDGRGSKEGWPDSSPNSPKNKEASKSKDKSKRDSADGSEDKKSEDGENEGGEEAEAENEDKESGGEEADGEEEDGDGSDKKEASDEEEEDEREEEESSEEKPVKTTAKSKK